MVELHFTVTDADTAAAVGSGSLAVLGTPRLLAWLEAATCAALADELAEGSTSVGTDVSIEHLRPSPVGAVVIASAQVSAREGRAVSLQVSARHTDGVVVGRGEIRRAIVDVERFLARLP